VTLSFANAVTYATNCVAPYGITTNDFNSDAKLDLVVSCNSGTGALEMLLGNGNGTFQTPPVALMAGTSLPLGVTSGSVRMGNANKDIVVADGSANTGVAVLLGNGNGTFAGTAHYSAGQGSDYPVIADFNKDGRPDIAVSNRIDNSLTMMIGLGAGTFNNPGVTVTTGTHPNSIAVGDVNHDGNLDVVSADTMSNTITVNYGDGAGGFGPSVAHPTIPSPATVTTGGTPESVALLDFNNDTHLDVVVANAGINGITVMFGTGMAATPFNTPTVYTAHGGAYAVVIADFNSDSKPDIAVSNQSTNDVSLFVGNGNGTFQPAVNVSVAPGTTPLFMAVGDFNGDTKPDIAVANNGSNFITVLLNTTM
jgi:hypothetical protein